MKPGRLERRETKRRELQMALRHAVLDGREVEAQSLRSALADHDMREADLALCKGAKALRVFELGRVPLIPGFARPEDAVRIELPRLKDLP